MRLWPPWASVTTAVTRYWPPISVGNAHGTGSAAEVTRQSTVSTTCSVHSPSSNTHSTRPAVTVTVTPGTAAPSMSVITTSTSNESPWRTNARDVRKPT